MCVVRVLLRVACRCLCVVDCVCGFVCVLGLSAVCWSACCLAMWFNAVSVLLFAVCVGCLFICRV